MNTFLIIIGSIITSFTQLVANRYGKQSILSPPSHCQTCRHTIAPKDNIPILSFILLKGKCRHCSVVIPYYYPVMECLGGLLAVYSVHIYHTTQTLHWPILLWAYFIFSQIDLEQQIIPNGWQLILLCITQYIKPASLNQWGIAVMIFAAYLIYDTIAPNTLGGADVKLLLLTFLYMDSIHTLYILMYACTIAIPTLLFFKKYTTAVPFVPFLWIGLCIHSYIDVFHTFYTLIH